MPENEKNLPDDLWRRVFDEAAETPPPRVWAGIERQLDENNGPKVLPLWGAITSMPLVWGLRAAAAVALLLIGWWAVPTMQRHTPQPIIATAQQPVASDNVAASAPALKQFPAEPQQRTEQNEPGRLDHAETRPLASAQSVSQKPFGQETQHLASPAYRSLRGTVQTILATEPVANGFEAVPRQQPEAIAELARGVVMSYERIGVKPLRLGELTGIQRVVWIAPGEVSVEPAEQKPHRSKREVWASVGLMPGAFNPAVSVAAPVGGNAYALNNASYGVQPTVSSRANVSVAYQAGAGVQLTDHWSIESGVGYLAGRSTVESPGQYNALSAQLGSLSNRPTAGNLYADALRNSNAGAQADAIFLNGVSPSFNNKGMNVSNAYDALSQQTIRNDYQYVQVPVQVGYQLRPRKRLTLAVLGGMITNIFVKNTVGDELVITAKDGVYRPVSWAATVGARLRYRPTRRWSASLAGLYQPALSATTRPESLIENRPTATGMSFGLDYHF